MNKRNLKILIRILSIANIINALLVVTQVISFDFIWITILLSILISGSELIKKNNG